MPFTAFRDRSFYHRFETIDVLYLLLSGEVPGPFGLEIGEIKAGRCEKAQSDGAGQVSTARLSFVTRAGSAPLRTHTPPSPTASTSAALLL